MTMVIDPERLNAFWRFVAERHSIFVRRHLYKQPPPWTSDPILQVGRFTHVYRDLDRVTRWLTIHVLPGGAKAPAMMPEDCTFNVLVYRRFCRPEVFTALGGPQPRVEWDWDQALRTLTNMQERGERIFTAAFMLTNAHSHDPKRELVVRHLAATTQAWPAVWGSVTTAESLIEAHQALLPLPGMGPFLAYEVLIDYCNGGLLPHSLDSWVYVGPGALRGASILAGASLTRVQASALITRLRDEQGAMLRQAGARLFGPRLTLENVEQTLCELQKAERLRLTGRIKRKFTPSENDDSLWDALPSKFTEETQWVQ